MPKTITTAIDENGNITTDVTGFPGHACLAEEDRLRKELASFGMVLTVQPGSTRQLQHGDAFHRAVRAVRA